MKISLPKKKKLIFLSIGFLLLLITLFCLYRLDFFLFSLSSPTLKTLDITSGANITIEGVGYPEAKILIYMNDSFTEETTADEDGNFSQSLVITTEGENTFKVKQTYKNIESDFSDSINTTSDLTAPEENSLNITSSIPETSKAENITLTGSIQAEDILLINDENQDVNEDGSFSINYPLEEGENNINFRLSDIYGNETSIIQSNDVYVDTTAPNIEYNYWSSNYGCETSSTEEIVSLQIESWTGYLDAYNSVPVVGCVSEDVESLTIDGKDIDLDNKEDLYQRISVYVEGGLNKYEVVATDKYGNTSTAYIETTAEKDGEIINLNVY